MIARVRQIAIAMAVAAAAALASPGCTLTSLRASQGRVPVLLGPVACMGCAPAPARGPADPRVAVGARQREYVIAVVADAVVPDATPVEVAEGKLISDRCREELRVSEIDAGTWDLDLVLLFGMSSTWINVQASRAAVPNGTCPATMNAPSAKPRDPRGP